MANQYTLVIEALVPGLPPSVPPPAGSPPGTASTPGSWPSGVTDPVVAAIRWYIDGTDGAGHGYAAGGTTQLPPPTASSFTPFSQLTNAWATILVQADQNYATIMAYVGQKIADQIRPPVAPPSLPWEA